MRPCLKLMFAVAVAAALTVCAYAQAETLVVVNGAPITRDALAHRLIDLSTVGQSQLQEMVNEALLFQEAKKQGLSVSDKEIDARLAEIKQKLGKLGKEDVFSRYLAGQEVSAAGLREKLRVKILVEKLLAAKTKVTDEEVKQAYNQHYELVNLRLILTKTKERADDAVKRLSAGEDFGAVAKALSEHAATAPNGGLVAQALNRDSLPPDLATPAFATEVGKYTQPIEMPPAGYYILKVEARTFAQTPTFNEAKDDIRAQLQDMKLQGAWVTWLEDARKRATIEHKWQP